MRNKLTEYIRENYSFDVWTLRLIDGIIDYFSESDEQTEILCDLLESINVPPCEIVENMEV